VRVVTSDEMRELDRRATDEFGIPSLLLMENAGAAVARTAAQMLATRQSHTHPPRTVVVAGRGNNGGDGFVAARHLHADGWDVRMVLAGPEERVQGDARVNLETLRRAGVPLEVVETALDRFEADLIVDALLGTGLRGDPTGLSAGLIEAINRSQAPVLAVDVPSGLDADTGRAAVCVRAACTVTFALPKAGLLLYPGREMAGIEQ
jgi:NAD(P)H-hydrate epimerase